MTMSRVTVIPQFYK